MFVKRWMDGMLGCNAMRTSRKAKSKPISKFMMMAKNGSFCWARRRHNKKAIRVCWYILHNVISQQQTNKQLLVWALARSLTLTILLAFRLYFILVSWHVCMNFVVECQKWIFAFWIWYSCCCTNRKKTKKRQRIYIYGIGKFMSSSTQSSFLVLLPFPFISILASSHQWKRWSMNFSSHNTKHMFASNTGTSFLPTLKTYVCMSKYMSARALTFFRVGIVCYHHMINYHHENLKRSASSCGALTIWLHTHSSAHCHHHTEYINN